MLDPSFIILYVDSPPASAGFYRDLLSIPILEKSPTFAMLALRPGMMLGLWSRRTVEPPAAGGSGGEVAFTIGGSSADESVDTVCTDWASRGLTIVQPPTDLDFGRSFVALDPDGHRLRVFTPAGPA